MNPQDIEEVWRRADPEFWEDIDAHLEPHEAPIRIEHAYAQQLTTWRDGFERSGSGQFRFDIGQRSNRERIKLNFQWSKTGPGGTETLNRWFEELQYIFRNEKAIKIYKATPYIPHTQDYQVWCQFIEVRHYGMPVQAYCVWNGDTIIQSKAEVLVRESAYDWTFDWRRSRTLEQMLNAVKNID